MTSYLFYLVITKPNCEICDNAKALLERHAVTFTTHNLKIRHRGLRPLGPSSLMYVLSLSYSQLPPEPPESPWPPAGHRTGVVEHSRGRRCWVRVAGSVAVKEAQKADEEQVLLWWLYRR